MPNIFNLHSFAMKQLTKYFLSEINIIIEDKLLKNTKLRH